MKLIATKDFYNNFGLDETGLTVHPNQVHKGHQFEIGNGEVLHGRESKLTALEKQLVAQLMVAGCVAQATPDVVKAVKAEVEADKKREATAARLNQQADASGLVKVLTDLLQKANTAATAAKPQAGNAS